MPTMMVVIHAFSLLLIKRFIAWFSRLWLYAFGMLFHIASLLWLAIDLVYLPSVKFQLTFF